MLSGCALLPLAALWSTGVKPLPLVEELIDATSEQVKRSGLYVDSSLKAYGLPKIYAAGDCAAVATGSSMRTDLVKLFAKADADGSGTLTKEEVSESH